jgi:bifunctional non-homologous end joining protein LigD
MKWDGRSRAFMSSIRDGVRISNRKGGDISAGIPSSACSQASARRPRLLDGEIVALDENSRPSFQLLQRRMHVRDSRALDVSCTRFPSRSWCSICLWRDGELLTELRIRSGGAALERSVGAVRAGRSARQHRARRRRARHEPRARA